MEDPKEIVIKIKTKNLKQILYFSVLSILILLVILQYFFPISCPTTCFEENDSQKIKQDTKDLAAGTVVIDPIKISTKEKEGETEEKQQEQEEEQEETTKDNEEEETEVSITGDVYFKIDDITYEVKGEDWAKVTKIKYTITNSLARDFTPKIYVYCYDDNDPGEVKNYIEEEIVLEDIESGSIKTETTDVSISFNEIDKEKTLKMILKDENENKLETVYKTFTVSS